MYKYSVTFYICIHPCDQHSDKHWEYFYNPYSGSSLAFFPVNTYSSRGNYYSDL